MAAQPRTKLIPTVGPVLRKIDVADVAAAGIWEATLISFV